MKSWMVTLLSYVQHVWLGKGGNVDFLKSKIGVNRENISLIKLGLIAHNFGHLIAVFTCQEHDLFTKKMVTGKRNYVTRIITMQLMQ